MLFGCSDTFPGEAPPHQARRYGWRLSFRELAPLQDAPHPCHFFLFGPAPFFPLALSAPLPLRRRPSPRASPCSSAPLFSLPGARLWPSLAPASCTGRKPARERISRGRVAHLFGAPGTRLGKRAPRGRTARPGLPSFGCCPPSPLGEGRRQMAAEWAVGRQGLESGTVEGATAGGAYWASVCVCFRP